MNHNNNSDFHIPLSPETTRIRRDSPWCNCHPPEKLSSCLDGHTPEKNLHIIGPPPNIFPIKKKTNQEAQIRWADKASSSFIP
jgi:hypothetical protein